MQDMTTIPQSQWGTFLAQFSADHRGQETDIEALDHGKVRPIAIRLPLIRMEASGAPGADPELHVSTGDQSGAIEGVIPHPMRIVVREWSDRGSAELELHSREGDAIRVRVSGGSAPVQ